MGGGDLNMKKSWHPVLLKNQEQVWQAEQEAAAERKKIAELQKQIQAERELLEMQRMQEAATGKRKRDYVEWMYQNPTSTESNISTDREDFLLGRKRIDQLLSAQPTPTKIDAVIGQQQPSIALDLKEKILNDPLLAMKRQEQARIQELVQKSQLEAKISARDNHHKNLTRRDSESRYSSSKREAEKRFKYLKREYDISRRDFDLRYEKDSESNSYKHKQYFSSSKQNRQIHHHDDNSMQKRSKDVEKERAKRLEEMMQNSDSIANLRQERINSAAKEEEKEEQEVEQSRALNYKQWGTLRQNDYMNSFQKKVFDEMRVRAR